MEVDPKRPPTSELAKLRALQLPIRTIRDFVAWLLLAEVPGDTPVRDLSVDDLIYRYYNIDQAKLARELAEAGPQQPKP